MKKQTLPLLIALLGCSSVIYGQVGINTTSPAATLDVTAKNTTGSTVDGLLIPRVDRLRAQSMTAVPTSTLIYVNSIANGSTSGTAALIDAVGYYFFNGTVWTKLGANSPVNIYNSDGTLTGNRIVTQGANTLAFNGSAANAFSVDGTTLSVDAANDRVGIGTTTPENRFHVVANPTGTGRYSLIDAAASTAEIPILALRNTSPVAANNTSYLGFSSNNASGGVTWGIGALQNSTAPNDNNFQIVYSNGGSFQKFFNIVPSGNTGIGTSTPQKRLHVNGGLQITNELNVGGDGATAGSAGTTGQVLTSAGAGAAPTWQALPAAPASVNIYNSDGTLTGNRVVTQGANTLAFNGTATNAFSVDGSTLSVDAANDRMGVGTATPQRKLHVTGGLQVTNELNVGGNATTAGSAGTAGQILTSAGAGAAPTWQNLAPNNDWSLTGNTGTTPATNFLGTIDNQDMVVRTNNTEKMRVAAGGNVGIGTAAPAVKLDVAQAIGTAESTHLRILNTSPVATDNTAYIGFNSYNGGGATWAIGSKQNSATAIDNNFQIVYSNGGNFQKFFNIIPSGNTGIGTATPQRKLHVNGDLQITNELNVGGDGATAGSAGTAGQYLVSSGAGTAPTWQNLNIPANLNIYNSDGTLTGNRVVTQGARTLAFNGTATNSFSVDGTTLSVDGANNRVGIGTIAPANNLHVVATTDPLRLDGVATGNAGTDQLMAINPSGVVKKIGTVEDLGIPRPAVFRLDTQQNDFLSAQGIGTSQVVPMTMIANGINGLTYNAATSTVTLPQGLYQIAFVYEAAHNATGCTISSYFVDFPLNAGIQRVHNTASHVQGANSNHGGTVNYTTTVPAGKTWQISLGRGQSGNCLGVGMLLAGLSTQVLIYKIGNN